MAGKWKAASAVELLLNYCRPEDMLQGWKGSLPANHDFIWEGELEKKRPDKKRTCLRCGKLVKPADKES